MANKSAQKKPIYKRWWFWLIVVSVVMGFAGGGGKSGETTVDNDAPATQVDLSESNVSEGAAIPTTENIKTTPSTTPALDPTPTTMPSPSSTPTPTSKPTPTQEPTTKPKPTPTPTQEPTPEQTQTPDPVETPTPTPQTIHGLPANTIVYVSDSSNKIHSVHDCSGMKNYREMTLGDADAKGYKYCTNCW